MAYPSLHIPNNQTNRIVGVCPETIISESPSKTSQYKCIYCSYISKKKTHCLRHMRTHTGEKPYKCEVCKRSFSRNDCLKLHIKTHSEKKSYECEVCNRSFSQNGSLKLHMKTHSGEKPYECKVCNRSFSQIGHFNIHMKTHTREKLHECEVCNRSFSRNYCLKLHMKTHSGEREKEFVCNKCNKRFTSKSNLISHIKHVHLKLKPYKCNFCEKQFTRNDVLLKHKKTQHKSHEISFPPNEKNNSQIDNLKISVEQHKGSKLPSKHSNQNIYSIGAQKSISSTTHSPDFTQEVSKVVFQNDHLDISLTEHNQCKSDGIYDDCGLSGSLQILTETSSADYPRNQAQYLSSGPSLAELPNPTAEWGHSLENISSSSISKHFDGSSFSPSLCFAETSNDIRTANPLSDSEKGYQTSVLESNRGLFYPTSPNPVQNNGNTHISELFIQEFGALDCHVSQNQQQPEKLSREEQEYIEFQKNRKHFEEY